MHADILVVVVQNEKRGLRREELLEIFIVFQQRFHGQTQRVDWGRVVHFDIHNLRFLIGNGNFMLQSPVNYRVFPCGQGRDTIVSLSIVVMNIHFPVIYVHDFYVRVGVKSHIEILVNTLVEIGNVKKEEMIFRENFISVKYSKSTNTTRKERS